MLDKEWACGLRPESNHPFWSVAVCVSNFCLLDSTVGKWKEKFNDKTQPNIVQQISLNVEKVAIQVVLQKARVGAVANKDLSMEMVTGLALVSKIKLFLSPLACRDNCNCATLVVPFVSRIHAKNLSLAVAATAFAALPHCPCPHSPVTFFPGSNQSPICC